MVVCICAAITSVATCYLSMMCTMVNSDRSMNVINFADGRICCTSFLVPVSWNLSHCSSLSEHDGGNFNVSEKQLWSLLPIQCFSTSKKEKKLHFRTISGFATVVLCTSIILLCFSFPALLHHSLLRTAPPLVMIYFKCFNVYRLTIM